MCLSLQHRPENALLAKPWPPKPGRTRRPAYLSLHRMAEGATVKSIGGSVGDEGLPALAE
jgi:hypothetical protein